MFKILQIIFLLTNTLFAQIENYKPIFEPYNQNSKQYVYIRQFTQDSKVKALRVDADTLATAIVLYEKKPKVYISKSNYYQMLKTYSSPPFLLSGYGVVSKNIDGVVITIDMCQSKKPFEKELFEKLKDKPVAICMSGKWLTNHKDEFEWLVANMKNVTWVNHSMTHPYDKNLPYDKNFLLSKGVNFTSEILDLEKLLIENNLTPSVYFRFPGLVSNEQAVKKLNALSLLPLSANAWLAKKEIPKNGSIILIHGNSNEPEGVKMFFEYDKQDKFTYQPLSPN